MVIIILGLSFIDFCCILLEFLWYFVSAPVRCTGRAVALPPVSAFPAAAALVWIKC